MATEQIFREISKYISFQKLSAILVIGFLLFAINSIVFNYLIKKYKIWKYQKSGLYEIDRMHGREFEKYLEAQFLKSGYKVSLTSYQNDYGADLVAYKNNKKIVIQAKRWNNKVGVKAIQEIVAAKGHYKATDAWVMTNNYYTKQAIELAASNDVKLYDRTTIVKQIKSIEAI